MSLIEKIDCVLKCILGDDLHGKEYDTLEELLENNGYSADQIAGLNVIERMQAAGEIMRKKPGRIENILAYLKLIFTEHYKWPDADVDSMTVRQPGWHWRQADPNRNLSGKKSDESYQAFPHRC